MWGRAELWLSSVSRRLKSWFSSLRATGIWPWSRCFGSDTGYLSCSAADFCWHPARCQRLTGSPLLVGLDWVGFLLTSSLECTESTTLQYCKCTFGNLVSKWNGQKKVLVTRSASSPDTWWSAMNRLSDGEILPLVQRFYHHCLCNVDQAEMALACLAM